MSEEKDRVYDFSDINPNPIIAKFRGGLVLEFDEASIGALNRYAKKAKQNGGHADITATAFLVAECLTEESEAKLRKRFPDKNKDYQSMLSELVPSKRVNILTELVKDLYGDLSDGDKKKLSEEDLAALTSS